MLKPVQIAYHVADPAAAAADSARRFGWGPFYLLEHVRLASCTYRGRPATFDHSSAYGQAGELMVEFITQHDDEPSVVRDLYRREQSGVHHVAHFVPDLDEALADFTGMGLVTAMHATTADGVAFAMVDATPALGHMLELYEPGPGLRNFYDFIRRKAEGWSGSEPVRHIRL
jgi:Glyoxalase/Bleomycin resistance protein/Dioxygenase superfamily